MKYGIITFHNIPNIGALLQAIGLCITIRNLGYECEIIDYSCANIVERELTFHKRNGYIKNLIAKYLWKKKCQKIKGCQEFMRSLHLYSNQFYNHNDIHSANNQYDGFISGSDMIWNLDVTKNDYSFFLDFVAADKRKVSYGSSIGAKWKQEDIPNVVKLLSSYHHLAVREQDTCDLLNDFNLDCKCVCDPTMLVLPDEWRKKAIKPPFKDYVLVYFPSLKNICAAKKYAKEHGLKVVVIKMGLPSLTYKCVSPNTPPEWIGLFENASAVFTGSYHGFLFSLYFEKLVWTDNSSNRIMSLVDKLSLHNCILDSVNDFENTIDYKKVKELINSMRLSSIEYLKNALKSVIV